jgi:hypothetical protein
MQSTNCETTQTVVSTSVQDVKHKKRNHEKRERDPAKRRESDPAKYKSRLLNKQKKVADRLSSLDPSETKKVQRLRSKLADINAKIESLPDLKNEKKDVVIPENKDVQKAPEPSSKVEEKTDLAPPVEVTPKSALKEESRKFLVLRKEMKQEKLRIKNLRKILSAVKLLSRANLVEATPQLLVNDDQVNQTKSDLAAAKEQLAEKRRLVKDQAHVVRDLIRLHRQMEAHKKHRKHGKKEKKNEKEKTRRHRKSKRDERDRKPRIQLKGRRPRNHSA